MKINKEEATQIIYEDHSDWDVIESEITDQGRWDTHMYSICKHTPTGLCYGVAWSRGSTENQDSEPFHSNDVEFTEVEQVAVIKTAWKPKQTAV